jgi:hypothetical protein
MTRDTWLFAISIIWFVALAATALFVILSL